MVSLTSVAIVAVLAVFAPLAVRLLRLPLPASLLEILLGIVVGPQVLGLVALDGSLQVMATVGLAFLLLLAGLEIETGRFRGPVLRRAALAFALSFGLALAAGSVFGALGLVGSPLLLAVILSATGLGVVLPVLQDSGRIGTRVGGLVVVGASIAEVVPIVLLSLLFSEDASAGLGSRVTLLIAFLAFVAVVVAVVLGLERVRGFSRALVDLQDTTAEVRVRAAVALLLVFASLAAAFGLESILGAFIAGAAITLLDRDEDMTHTAFYTKLHAVGYGAFVPFFFVATGAALDVRGLVEDPASLARIPLFLFALLLVRGLPALLYRPLLHGPGSVVASGLLQATSLSIPVVAGEIGVALGLLSPTNYVALVAAGLLSVVLFPPLALTLLRREGVPEEEERRAATTADPERPQESR